MNTRSPIALIRKGPIDEILEVIKERRAWSRKYVNAFLVRCQVETVSNPVDSLRLCVRGPDYVLATAIQEPNLLAWAYGVLGTCFSINNMPQLASDQFAAGSRVEGITPMEAASIVCRQAAHLTTSNWAIAHSMADEAVVLADSKENECELREDKCFIRFVAIRGVVRAYGAYAGEDIGYKYATDDFQAALAAAAESKKDHFLSRQTALLGISQIACRAWLSGEDAPMSVDEVLYLVTETKRQTRIRRIPKRSPLHCYCRWAEGLAYFKRAGSTLTRHARRILTSSRNDFVAMGRIASAVEVSLDLQWCLIFSAEYGEALTEYEFIKSNMATLPESWRWILESWEQNLKTRAIEHSVVRQVFYSIRGVRRVMFPEPPRPVALAVVDSGGW